MMIKLKSLANRVVPAIVQKTATEQTDRMASDLLSARSHGDHPSDSAVRVLLRQVAAVVRGLRGQRQQAREELRLVREHGRVHRLHVPVLERGCHFLEGRSLPS